MSVEERRAKSKLAWKQAFDRLCYLAGDDWPIGQNPDTPEIMAAESAANKATSAYIAGENVRPSIALDAWEKLMTQAIARVKKGEPR